MHIDPDRAIVHFMHQWVIGHLFAVAGCCSIFQTLHMIHLPMEPDGIQAGQLPSNLGSFQQLVDLASRRQQDACDECLGDTVEEWLGNQMLPGRVPQLGFFRLRLFEHVFRQLPSLCRTMRLFMF